MDCYSLKYMVISCNFIGFEWKNDPSPVDKIGYSRLTDWPFLPGNPYVDGTFPWTFLHGISVVNKLAGNGHVRFFFLMGYLHDGILGNVMINHWNLGYPICGQTHDHPMLHTWYPTFIQDGTSSCPNPCPDPDKLWFRKIRVSGWRGYHTPHKKYREDRIGKIPIGSHWQSEMSVEPLLISNLIWSLIISDCGWYGHYNNNYIYIYNTLLILIIKRVISYGSFLCCNHHSTLYNCG